MIAALILQLAIVAPVAPRDTTGHVDMRVGQSFTLGVNGSIAVKWSSGNSAVASVSVKGLVTAKARGYATITATTGAEKATIRACVVNAGVEFELLTVAERSVSIDTVPFTLATGQSRQLLGVAQLRTTSPTEWGECRHWYLTSDSRRWATIDRRGLVHFNGDSARYAKLAWGAMIGPSVP